MIRVRTINAAAGHRPALRFRSLSATMKRSFQMVARWLRVLFSQAPRGLVRERVFAKYQIAARCPVRYIERKLRRKVLRRFRTVLK